jgi:hypothetical protein
MVVTKSQCRGLNATVYKNISVNAIFYFCTLKKMLGFEAVMQV